RDRLWFVAHTDRAGREQGGRDDPTHGHRAPLAAACDAGCDGTLAGTECAPAPVEYACSGRHGDADQELPAGRESAVDNGRGSAWSAAAWIIGHDGKARRVEPGIRLLAHGVPARVGRLRAYGNAIVPQVAAEVIGAFLDCCPEAA